MEKARKKKTYVDEEMMQRLNKAYGGLENIKASHIVAVGGVAIATAEKILSVGFDFKRYKEKYYKEKKQPAAQKEMFVEKVEKDDFDKYREEKTIEGQEFEDYVLTRLISDGLYCVKYVSQKFQYRYGENSAGIEIKKDNRFQNTHQLFIETEEKSHPSKPKYQKSGIYRRDNSWLFAIGDEDVFWVFGKRTLMKLIESKNYEIRENQYKTGIGVLVPVEDADEYCERKLLKKRDIKMNKNGSMKEKVNA